MFSSFKLFQTAQNQLDHNQLFALINSLQGGFIAVDDSNKITVSNSQALGLLDVNSLDGKNLADVLQLFDSQGQPVDIAKLLMNSRSALETELYHLKKSDGSTNRLNIEISPIKTVYNSPQISGHVLLIRPVPENQPASSG